MMVPLWAASAALAEVGVHSQADEEDLRLFSYTIDPVDVWKAMRLVGCTAALEGFDEWARWNREVGSAGTRRWLDWWNNKQGRLL